MKFLDYRENKQQGTFNFPIAYYHVESSHPHYQMSYHWHPEYEVIRILEGNFQLTLNGSSYHATEGDVILIQGGTLHGGIPENCIYECIVFDIKLLLSNNKLCNKLIQKLIQDEVTFSPLLPKESFFLINIVHDLFMAMHSKNTGYEFVTQGKLYSLFGFLYEAQLIKEDTSKPTASSQQIKRFKEVLDYIENHYSEQITLEDMSKVAGLSPRYLCRFFRKMTQRTPTDYLNYFRIECACELLTNQELSITDIALSCGFNDISYFIKFFRRSKGITPKQFQKSNKV